MDWFQVLSLCAVNEVMPGRVHQPWQRFVLFACFYCSLTCIAVLINKRPIDFQPFHAESWVLMMKWASATCPVDVDRCAGTVDRLSLSVQVEGSILRSVGRSYPEPRNTAPTWPTVRCMHAFMLLLVRTVTNSFFQAVVVNIFHLLSNNNV